MAYSVISRKDIVIQERDAFADKNSARVAIISGSSEYYGAPSIASNAALNSLAALRAGSGYVHTLVPESILDLVRKFSPNMVVNAIGKDTIRFNEKSKSAIQKADAVIIGMGIGKSKKAFAEAKKILDFCIAEGKKVLLDAEAINLIKEHRNHSVSAKNTVITPHDGEFFRLSGIKVSKRSIEERANAAMDAAERFNVCVVLKGHITAISDGELTKVNVSKNPALATMGSGDALSGIIGAMMSLKLSTIDSSVTGVYIHSMIGESLYRKKGEHVIAMDIIDEIPAIMKRYV
jgi:NAD(P)H-hydrate epimerase